MNKDTFSVILLIIFFLMAIAMKNDNGPSPRASVSEIFNLIEDTLGG